MKAVFVFCEGAHDVKFAARSLGGVATATWVGDPIKELPSPLGPIPDPDNPKRPKLKSLIAERYAERSLDEMSLQAASHAPPPAFEAIVRDGTTLFVLLRCAGDTAAASVMKLLSDMTAVLTPAFGTDVKQIAAAFLFDADASVATREALFEASYQPILGPAPGPKHGAWVLGKDFPVGLHVFHDAATQQGTLEEILAPLVELEWSTRWHAASAYLTSHAGVGDPVSKKPAERLKAQINITGQFVAPGDPMSEVIGRNGLSASHFDGAHSKALVAFLQGVPW
jgi:hypothetical protein